MVPKPGQVVRLRGTDRCARVARVCWADGGVIVATGEAWKFRDLCPAPWWLRLLLRLGWPNV